MTITEFLLARIAEDEALARKVEERMEHVPPRTPGGVGNLGIVGYPYARVLAECQAKRAILENHPEEDDAGFCGDGIGLLGCKWRYPCPTISALAAVYADHPDYDQAWRA